MPEQKAALDPLAFLTFGIGPRNCIGMRFIKFQMDVTLVLLVRRFRFSPGPNSTMRGLLRLFQALGNVRWTIRQMSHFNGRARLGPANSAPPTGPRINWDPPTGPLQLGPSD
ncbi:hypothetical protein niasHT_013783 [Heterodera trifolii]|uniref:Cytochrome P450 n=1 Tax=Heterodera trifolii TaxID=157864 RepID=A0ABD2KUG6_9BILA